MKKTLVAIAALAAFGAQAQSTVTLSGNIDFASASVSGTQPGSNGKTVSTTVGTSSTSVIKIAAVEDLGNGLKATAFYALDPRTLANDSFAVTEAAATKVTATGLARDEMYVALTGSFGGIKLGSPNSLGLETAGDASPLGTAIGSGYAPVSGQGMNSIVQTRYNRSMRYDSPSFAGLTAHAMVAQGNDTVAVDAVAVATQIPNARSATELGLKYANGPLKASVAQVKQSAQNNKTGWYSGGYSTVAAQPAATSATIAAVNYTIGSATLYAGYNTGDRLAVMSATNGAAVQSKGSRLAVKYTMGQIDLIAQQTAQKVSGDTTAANNVKSKVNGLRADYNFSKTAAAYVGYEKWNTNLATDAAKGTGGDRKIVSIGLRKSF